jgi:hypothetical protein
MASNSSFSCFCLRNASHSYLIMPRKCATSSVRYARARAAAQGPGPAIGRRQLPDIAIKLRCSDAHGIGSTQIFTAAISKIIRGASWAASVSTTLQYSMRKNRKKKQKSGAAALSLDAARKKQRAFCGGKVTRSSGCSAHASTLAPTSAKLADEPTSSSAPAAPSLCAVWKQFPSLRLKFSKCLRPIARTMQPAWFRRCRCQRRLAGTAGKGGRCVRSLQQCPAQ